MFTPCLRFYKFTLACRILQYTLEDAEIFIVFRNLIKFPVYYRSKIYLFINVKSRFEF